MGLTWIINWTILRGSLKIVGGGRTLQSKGFKPPFVRAEAFVRNSAFLPLKRTKPIPEYRVGRWVVGRLRKSRYTCLFLQISPPLILIFNLNSSNWKQNAKRDLEKNNSVMPRKPKSEMTCFLN